MSFQITFPETAAAEDIKKDDSGNGNDSTIDGKSTDDNKVMTQIRSRMEQDGQSGTGSSSKEQTVPAETAEQMEIPHRVVTISPEVVLPPETVEVHL